MPTAQNSHAATALPKIPALVSLNEQPPEESERIVIGTSPTRLKLFANSDNSGKMVWVSDVSERPSVFSISNWQNPYLTQYWDGGPPANYTMTLRRYYRQVSNSYTQIPHGTSLEWTVTSMWGISSTDSQTISAELGVEVGGLGAKITAEFSHSVTTSEEQHMSRTEKLESPEPGKIRAWVAWQLVEELIALGPDGQPIGSGDKGAANRKADVKWSGFSLFPDVSGAWIYYPSTCLTMPQDNIVYDSKDFPAT
jgi:hypothetical protein